MTGEIPYHVQKKHIFIIGAKCIGQYGGFETFLDKLTEQHQNDTEIQYYIVTKANGDGYMNEEKLSGVKNIDKNLFIYHNARVIKLYVPQIGSAQAVIYDIQALNFCLRYVEKNQIPSPIFYILACRIGPFFAKLVKKAHKLGGKVYVNPDGNEWKRSKWSRPVRMYWKKSEQLMIKHSDLIICDSVHIEKYIKKEYQQYHPNTIYISYGADTKSSGLSDDDPRFVDWLKINGIKENEYYMCCGRLVPENSIEIMIREFMKSKSKRDFVLITTYNPRFFKILEKKTNFQKDHRIKFVGSIYDSILLKKIREKAYAYIHGHTVGGTNPSLLEALASTDINLLIDVTFNREVAKDSALYWTPKSGNLSDLIDSADIIDRNMRNNMREESNRIINNSYNWRNIAEKYSKIWNI